MGIIKRIKENKGKPTKNKGFLICYTTFIILAITDLTLTLTLWDFGKHLETNLLYIKTQTITPVILLNILLIIILWIYYNYFNDTWRYLAIHLMITTIFLRIKAISHAIHYIKHPITIQKAIEIGTTSAKITYAKSTLILIYLPLILGVLSFLLWRLDHKVRRIDVKN